MGEGAIPPPNFLTSTSFHKASLSQYFKMQSPIGHWLTQKMEFKKCTTCVLLILLAIGMLSASAPAPFFALASGNREHYLVPAIPAWQQVNSNGFGDPQAPEVSALEAFNGYLYAGTYNPVNPAPGQLYDGAQIFRSPDGSSSNSCHTARVREHA